LYQFMENEKALFEQKESRVEIVSSMAGRREKGSKGFFHGCWAGRKKESERKRFEDDSTT